MKIKGENASTGECRNVAAFPEVNLEYDCMESVEKSQNKNDAKLCSRKLEKFTHVQ